MNKKVRWVKVTLSRNAFNKFAMFHAFVGDQACACFSSQRLPLSPERAARLKAAKAAVQQLLEKLHAADPATVLVVAEATGMLHLDFCEAFEKAGCQVVAINPLMAAIAASVIPSATTRRISSTPSLWPSSDSGITKSY